MTDHGLRNVDPGHDDDRPPGLGQRGHRAYALEQGVDGDAAGPADVLIVSVQQRLERARRGIGHQDVQRAQVPTELNEHRIDRVGLFEVGGHAQGLRPRLPHRLGSALGGLWTVAMMHDHGVGAQLSQADRGGRTDTSRGSGDQGIAPDHRPSPLAMMFLWISDVPSPTVRFCASRRKRPTSASGSSPAPP